MEFEIKVTPKYQLGRVVNKYLIQEIINYAKETSHDFMETLHATCCSFRSLVPTITKKAIASFYPDTHSFDKYSTLLLDPSFTSKALHLTVCSY